MRRAQQSLSDARLDALIVTHLPNVRYLCGFTGSAAVLAITERGALVFSDGRYTQQAKDEVRAARIKILRGKSALASAMDWLGKQKRLRRVGIEPAHLSVADKGTLARSVGHGGRLVNAPPMIERMRMVKDKAEIGLIRAACHLGVRLFSRLQEVVRSGASESRVAGELEFAAREAGAEQMAFSTIIAGGARSALPHGRASATKLPARGLVVCDFGVILAGYCSDMTRTLHVGRPRPDARGAYEAVKDAQQAGLEAVQPGKTVGEVDLAARKLLRKRNLDKYFTHSTGHGLGLEIHEAPRVAAGQNDLLRPGMVITIEPGVYVPGKWGVRIEDTVVVTEKGCEILTACSKDLISV
jgi:Xaa-Pro aminopeptidase